MTDNLEQRFVSRIQELLVALPYDLKVLFEAMTDLDLSTEARELAAGAVVYCLSPSDPIPDSMGLVGFVDDVVVVRLTLAKLLDLGGADTEDYPDRFSDQFGPLNEDIELMRAYLGETISWVDWRLEMLPQSKYKGKSVKEYVGDEEIGQSLYEMGLEFTTDYEIDDEAAAKLVSGEPVLDAFSKVYEVERSRREQK
jgi:uncharacterized membrane protein YkvA (DUF1232 family)